MSRRVLTSVVASRGVSSGRQSIVEGEARVRIGREESISAESS